MDKNTEIKEITLNPRFLTNDVYESLKNQGVSVRWMNVVMRIDAWLKPKKDMYKREY